MYVIFSQQVVLTTLLVACSTSFVLNAYNFLFLNRFAIYVWFAIAPLIWVVCPLTGAAWVTKTYLNYKLVVVNAWVDIPEVRFSLALFSHRYSLSYSLLSPKNKEFSLSFLPIVLNAFHRCNT